MNILVDPVVLTLPEPPVSVETCLRFVEHLSAWSQEVIAHRHEFFVSESCLLALYESGRYPEMRTLLPLWNTVPFLEVDCRTAFAACQRILMNVPYLEDRVSRPDILVHSERVLVAPDLIGRLHKPVAEALRETLGYVAYAREVSGHPVASDLVLITHPIQDGEGAKIDVCVETEEGTTELMTDLPLAETPTDLLNLAGLEAFWQDTGQALAWAVADLIRKGTLNNTVPLAQYAVTPEFNRSIHEHGFHNRPDRLAQIFWKITQLLVGNIAHADVHANHPLKRDNKPLTAERWEAWRLHITRGNLGMRLHYWWQDGCYILSKVGPHNDFTIGPVPKNVCS